MASCHWVLYSLLRWAYGGQRDGGSPRSQEYERLNNMKTIHELLLTNDAVPVLYRKADGSIASYLLTKRLAPSYDAKTERVKVETPAHLVNAYNLTTQKFVSLKLENITIAA